MFDRRADYQLHPRNASEISEPKGPCGNNTQSADIIFPFLPELATFRGVARLTTHNVSQITNARKDAAF
jgi:hypothetical protein